MHPAGVHRPFGRNTAGGAHLHLSFPYADVLLLHGLLQQHRRNARRLCEKAVPAAYGAVFRLRHPLSCAVSRHPCPAAARRRGLGALPRQHPRPACSKARDGSCRAEMVSDGGIRRKRALFCAAKVRSRPEDRISRCSRCVRRVCVSRQIHRLLPAVVYRCGVPVRALHVSGAVRPGKERGDRRQTDRRALAGRRSLRCGADGAPRRVGGTIPGGLPHDASHAVRADPPRRVRALSRAVRRAEKCEEKEYPFLCWRELSALLSFR